jgi:nicotinamidase/pyrazinamidase
VGVLNAYIAAFRQRGLPIVATRDWHPPGHCSFAAQGGPWPPHCVAGTPGAGFAALLELPCESVIVSKATQAERDAYSGFEGTNLHELLKMSGVGRVYVGGLATDYCVLNTVRDALRLDYDTVLLTDAIRAVDVHPGDGERAMAEMLQGGAIPATLADIRG